jgi:gamma-glutamyltranspeptidase / glutathione hydrolase
VEPDQNGPGGEVPVIFCRVDDARPTVLCAQGPAPAGATPGRFGDLGMTLVPGSGLLAAAIPGAVPGWLTLLRDHGTLPLAEVMAPSVFYARHGYPVTNGLSQSIAGAEARFREHWPTSAGTYLTRGSSPPTGERLTNPALAGTFQRLVEASQLPGLGREAGIEAALAAWSQGFVADAIDAFARIPCLDSSGVSNAGVLTGSDLAGWAPSYEEAVCLDFQGVTVCKTGPWGQGPVLLQSLALVDGLDLVPGTADFVHYIVEAIKLAFADREAWYGDSRDVPIDELLSESYTVQRRTLMSEAASWQLRPGSPAGVAPVLPAWLTGLAEASVPAPGAGNGDPITRSVGVPTGDTVHVDVVDRWGNMVAAMPSGGWLQSSPVIPDLGFPLGTRLQMAWLEQGLPSSLMPGKRPRTTLSPTLAMRDGRAVLACGSPGGDQQDQWQLVFLMHHLLGGLNLQEAIDAPTFHSTAVPSSFHPRDAHPGRVVLEERLGDEVIRSLRQRGHDVEPADAWSLGRLCAVGRDPATGLVRAAANPRGMQGYAVGR